MKKLILPLTLFSLLFSTFLMFKSFNNNKSISNVKATNELTEVHLNSVQKWGLEDSKIFLYVNETLDVKNELLTSTQSYTFNGTTYSNGTVELIDGIFILTLPNISWETDDEIILFQDDLLGNTYKLDNSYVAKYLGGVGGTSFNLKIYFENYDEVSVKTAWEWAGKDGVWFTTDSVDLTGKKGVIATNYKYLLNGVSKTDGKVEINENYFIFDIYNASYGDKITLLKDETFDHYKLDSNYVFTIYEGALSYEKENNEKISVNKVYDWSPAAEIYLDVSHSFINETSTNVSLTSDRYVVLKNGVANFNARVNIIEKTYLDINVDALSVVKDDVVTLLSSSSFGPFSFNKDYLFKWNGNKWLQQFEVKVDGTTNYCFDGEVFPEPRPLDCEEGFECAWIIEGTDTIFDFDIPINGNISLVHSFIPKRHVVSLFDVDGVTLIDSFSIATNDNLILPSRIGDYNYTWEGESYDVMPNKDLVYIAKTKVSALINVSINQVYTFEGSTSIDVVLDYDVTSYGIKNLTDEFSCLINDNENSNIRVYTNGGYTIFVVNCQEEGDFVKFNKGTRFGDFVLAKDYYFKYENNFWQMYHKVKFDNDVVYVKDGSKVENKVIQKESTPTTDYTCAWYLSGTNDLWDFDTLIYDDLSLYHNFVETNRKYKATFYDFDGITILDEFEIENGSDINFYQIDGFTFEWNGENYEKMPTHNISYTLSKKTPNNYTLTFKGASNVNVIYGQEIGELPKIPQVDGKEGLYWTINDERINANTIYSFASNMTAEAVYKDITTINFKVMGRDDVNINDIVLDRGESINISEILKDIDINGYRYSVTVNNVPTSVVVADSSKIEVIIAFEKIVEDKGCGGAITTSSLIISLFSLASIILIKNRKASSRSSQN